MQRIGETLSRLEAEPTCRAGRSNHVRGGEAGNVSGLMAVGVSEDDRLDIPGIAEGCKEDQAGRSESIGRSAGSGLTF